jgi:hypothetical protein
VNFILQDKIPKYMQPFVDDVPVKGPETFYLLPDGSYKTIPENKGIQWFIWEHMETVNGILQRIQHAGGTFNAKKSFFTVPRIKVVGHVCSYKGRTPDESKVQKIHDWPPCEDLTDSGPSWGRLASCRFS